MGILQSCQPREDIISGTINLQIFTASLGEVLKKYRHEPTQSSDLYTDGLKFFGEGTYATEGIKSVLQSVVARLSGDASAPSFRRLDTAFGGGKTHTLIACAHVAYRGKELAGVLDGYLMPEMIARLPAPGSVIVVGVPCDTLDLYKNDGKESIPYTLWGEIARQVGGQQLYNALGKSVTSRGAPGAEYFEKVFGGKKAVLLLDELAQYAVRLEAEQRGASDNLCAFLMGLDDYFRNHDGLCLVLTLASHRDAFSSQTKNISNKLRAHASQRLSEDELDLITDKAEQGLNSVVTRSAINTTPVSPDEITSVLSRRLFVKIDHQQATETARDYMRTYTQNKSALPEKALKADYENSMIAAYPFHPSFIDYLNHKLAASANFQGTRGVLRMLSLCIHNIWKKQRDLPMIHDCDLDLTDLAISDELFGKTNSGELRPVLVTDVSSGNINSPSKAEQLDEKYPHPAGEPLFRNTWQSVFLNSLVGSDQSSNAFGVAKPEVCLEVVRPGVSSANVDEALRRLDEEAMYLRSRNGKYFASTEPSVNRALSEIRSKLTEDESNRLIRADAEKICKKNDEFDVVCNVRNPGDIPDRSDRPVVGFIALDAENIDPQNFFTCSAAETPRKNQNNLVLIVPDSVNIDQDSGALFSGSVQKDKILEHLSDIAATILARRKLQKDPGSYNIKQDKVTDPEYLGNLVEREHALEIEISAAYRRLLIPADNDNCFETYEIKAGSGESGGAFLDQTKKILLDSGKYVDETAENRLNALAKLFFDTADHISVHSVRHAFAEKRSWPMAKNRDLVERLLRRGSDSGAWSVFHLEDGASYPDKLFNDKNKLPFSECIQDDWDLLSKAGLVKRGWGEERGLDKEKAAELVTERIKSTPILRVSQLKDDIQKRNPEAEPEAIRAHIAKTLQNSALSGEIYICGKAELQQTEKPVGLTRVNDTTESSFNDDTVILTKNEVQKRGWTGVKSISLTDGYARSVLPRLLPRLGHLKNVASTIDQLRIDSAPLKSGGTLSIEMHNLKPNALNALDDFFADLARIIEFEREFDADFDINSPQENCALVAEIRLCRKGED